MATAKPKPTSKNRTRSDKNDSGHDDKRLRKQVLKLLGSAEYHPMDKSEMARTMGISPKQRQAFRQILGDLKSAGKITQVKKGRYVLEEAKSKKEGGDSGNEVIGILRFQPAGHAFVDPEKGREKGVFIPPGSSGVGLHGDLVAVQLSGKGGGKPGAPKWTKNVKNEQTRAKLEKKFSGGKGGGSSSSRGAEGRVVRVVERRNAAVISTFRERGRFVYAKPDDSMLPPTIELDERDLPDPAPMHGDKVVVEIDHWESVHNHPRGRVTKVLGAPDSPGIDILQVIYAYRLPLEFPDAVMAEAVAFPDHVTEADIEGREDWRDRPVFTIDPATAKDFDDAILVERTEHGGWELAVHIADVSHYVKPNTALDREARNRGNSTYLADRVIPMLPHALSNGLCSLVPDEDRLTHAAVMSFNKKGELRKVRFCRAVIRSARRFSYEEAYELMQKPDPSDPFSERLDIAWELASKLRRRRFANGGLDLDMPEVRAVLDDDGKPIAMQRSEYDESHQLIEEFMLVANEAVAKHTKDKMKPSIYRAHEDPDADKLFEFRQMALDYGIRVGDLSNREEIQKLLKAAAGQPHEHAIKVGLLKSLKRAAYSEHSEGHYGLAKENYTHFTSPIRRYADLIVHRVLASATGTAKDKTPKLSDLADIAEHLSVTERISADAENETQKLKQLEFLWNEAKAAGKSNPATHPALIHEVRRKGLFIELSDYFIKGLITELDLPECRGGYWFDGTKMRFVGSNPSRTFQAGDTIEVAVSRVDFERKMVDFRVIEEGTEHREPTQGSSSPKAKPASRSRGGGAAVVENHVAMSVMRRETRRSAKAVRNRSREITNRSPAAEAMEAEVRKTRIGISRQRCPAVDALRAAVGRRAGRNKGSSGLNEPLNDRR